MLTIFALNDAKAASRYYEEDNYYHKGSPESIAATHWWGKGAQLLGLNDYVDPQRFIELLEGKIDKNTTLSRTRHDGGVAHKPGYDLTFSAPKSVSMLAEIGHDFRIYDAHNLAVNAALEYLQSNVAQYRQTKDSITQVKNGNNLIVAKFRHDTSRSVEGEIDCQLHTHSVVMNAIHCEDGQWRSLNEKALFEYTKTGGMIYRATLAKELKKLGYQIEKTREDGLFEVSGFTRDQIESFSKRRVKILEVMDELGLFGSNAAQEVTLNTRESKIAIDRNKLHDRWLQRAEKDGLDIPTIIEKSYQLQRTGHWEIKDHAMIADKALQYALDHLGERQSVFEEKDIHRTALHYSLGDIDIDHVDAALKRFTEQQKIISLGTHNHRVRYTTPLVIEREEKIIEIMKAGQGEFDQIASKEAVNVYLEMISKDQAVQLTNCQQKAIQFVITSTDQVLGVQGYAGTGKTTLLRAVCRLAEEAGYSIRGAAPSASAADVLRSDTAIRTDTLSKLIIDLKKESRSVEKMDSLSTQPEIILLDEASMASTHQMYDFLELTKNLNKRVVLVGDRLQLPAVEAGDPFGLLQDSGMQTAILTQIVRQEAKDLKFAVRETIRNDIDLATQAIGNDVYSERPAEGNALRSEKSSVNEISNKVERLDTIAQSYLKLNNQDRGETIVLLGSNEDRQYVNDIIRNGLRKKDEIHGAEVDTKVLQARGLTAVEKFHVPNYQIGDILRFNKAYRSLGIKRFDYVKVLNVDHKNEQLVLKKGNTVIYWKPSDLAKIQGGVVDVYEESDRKLAAGDFIRWTQNRKNHEIYNTETAEVVSIENNSAKIKLRNEKIITLDLTQKINAHWDYAWSSTVYAAQGKKANRVIAQFESYNRNLTHYRSFYVVLSRAVNSIQLYVDNWSDAIKTIKKHTGEKSNATAFIESQKEKNAYEKYVQSAYQKIDGHIYEVNSESARLNKLADRYVSLNGKGCVCLIAPDFKDRTRLNALIREKLMAKGVLGLKEYPVTALRKYRIRSNDQNMKLTKDMIICFTRGYKKYAIESGEYYHVKDIADLENKVILKNNRGKEANVDIYLLVKRQDKDINIFKSDKLSLTKGDVIRWTKSYRDVGIIRDKNATVIDINDNKVTLKLSKNKSISLLKNDPRMMHWHYAYTFNLSDSISKYDIGLAHLDERTQSTARIEAIFGALGKSSKGAELITHSYDYVIDKLKAVSGKDINLSISKINEKNDTFHYTLDKYQKSQHELSKAWVIYYDRKTKGLDSSNNLRNALIIDKAHAELAHSIVSDPLFNEVHAKAFGFNVKNIKKYANKYKKQEIIDLYFNANGILKEHYSYIINKNKMFSDKDLNNYNINKTALDKLSDKYSERITMHKMSKDERNDIKIVRQYLENSKHARLLWQRIYREKDNGCKPDQSRFDFASHISSLRNKLAYEIITKPNRFKRLIKTFDEKAKNIINIHAKLHKASLESNFKRECVLKTHDWKYILCSDQNMAKQYRNIQYVKQGKNDFLDKDMVLMHIMPKAEDIISNLIEEEKNYRMTNGNKVIWGKKHGSVHLHINGSKAGLVNDYERNIHGDIIHYYAKTRGIQWYDALNELANMSNVNLDKKIEKMPISKGEKERKEKTLLKDRKKRERMRQLAIRTWNEAIPIQGTLAETYLKKHRGINYDISKLEVRFHNAAPDIIGHQDNKLKVYDRKPAMVVRFENEAHEITGIQCTYLDPKTANKNMETDISKRSIGSIWGSAGILYQGGNEKVIVAEGSETGMSLVSIASKSSIYITGGNMQNIGHYSYLADQHNQSSLHIAADNDLSFEAGSWKATESGAKKLAKQNIQVLISVPDVIKDKKTDFNDTLRTFGESAVYKQFMPKYKTSINGNADVSLKEMKLPQKHKDNTKGIDFYELP